MNYYGVSGGKVVIQNILNPVWVVTQAMKKVPLIQALKCLSYPDMTFIVRKKKLCKSS